MKYDNKWFVSLPKRQRATYVHGHKVYIDLDKNGELAYFYWKTKKICEPNTKDIPPCPHCKKQFVEYKFGWIDPCLGELPGVRAACCGHGKEEGCVVFENGKIIRCKNMSVDGITNGLKAIKLKRMEINE